MSPRMLNLSSVWIRLAAVRLRSLFLYLLQIRHTIKTFINSVEFWQWDMTVGIIGYFDFVCFPMFKMKVQKKAFLFITLNRKNGQGPNSEWRHKYFARLTQIYLDAFTTELLKIWIVRNSQLLIHIMLMAKRKPVLSVRMWRHPLTFFWMFSILHRIFFWVLCLSITEITWILNEVSMKIRKIMFALTCVPERSEMKKFSSP